MIGVSKILNGISKESKYILELMHKKGPVTKLELTKLTNIPLSTLNRIMSPLEQNEIITAASTGSSTGGRKPQLFDINPKSGYIIGVDISRLYTQLIVVDMKMNILSKNEFNMDYSCTPEFVISKILTFIKDYTVEESIDYEDILGIGIGGVGPLDSKKGIINNPVKFFSPGWQNVEIKRIIETAIGIPTIIDNGANCAALTEYHYRNNSNYNNIVYINCGMGIRTGFISNGNIIRTINGIDDVFGHMIINIDGEQCSCGNYGCLECYCSIPAIVQKFSSSLKAGRTSIVDAPINQISYVDICNAAEKNDSLARDVILNAATIFGVGLSNYINLLNPELIILSGPLIKHSDLFFRISEKTALNKCFLKGTNNITFKKEGIFEDNAISIGAALLVMKNILNYK